MSTATTQQNPRNSAQHTPGTWQADFLTVYTKLPNERNEPAICEIYQENFISISEAQANANLIAAAPDMLEELQKAKTLISQMGRAMLAHPDCTPDSQFDGLTDMAESRIDAIEAAISKAKGGSHE